jgi:hypothetical protein
MKKLKGLCKLAATGVALAVAVAISGCGTRSGTEITYEGPKIAARWGGSTSLYGEKEKPEVREKDKYASPEDPQPYAKSTKTISEEKVESPFVEGYRESRK